MRSASELALRAIAHALGCCYCWDYGCEPATADVILERIKHLRGIESDKYEAQFSTRELRRAHKALKNRVMYRLMGRRPWARETGRSIFAYGQGHRFPCDTYDVLYAPPNNLSGTRPRLKHLREPSGFKEMSRVAEMAGRE